MQNEEYSKTRKYEAPEVEIIRFDVADVITASGGDSGDTSGHATRLPLVR